MKSTYHGLLSIHCAVLLFGIAGLFGKFLDLSPAIIVFGRTFFASIAIAFILPFLKMEFRCKNLKDLPGFILMGAILAIHWVTFFYSIQVSTVAIGLLSFSSFPIFVTFLEPIFFDEQLSTFDIMISVIVFVGLTLVIPEFNLSNNLTLGVFWGLISGFTFAILSLLNRRFVANYPAITISLYQDAVACLILLPFVKHSILSVTLYEAGQLILLGIVFTALAHTLFIRGMSVVKAQLASVIACLEPVYGILFALLLLHEIPSQREIMGGVVIIGAILYATRHSKKSTHKQVVL